MLSQDSRKATKNEKLKLFSDNNYLRMGCRTSLEVSTKAVRVVALARDSHRENRLRGICEIDLGRVKGKGMTDHTILTHSVVGKDERVSYFGKDYADFDRKELARAGFEGDEEVIRLFFWDGWVRCRRDDGDISVEYLGKTKFSRKYFARLE